MQSNLLTYRHSGVLRRQIFRFYLRLSVFICGLMPLEFSANCQLPTANYYLE